MDGIVSYMIMISMININKSMSMYRLPLNLKGNG